MATQVDLAQLKRDLGKLMRRARQGEEIVVCTDGRPVVQLAPYDSPVPSR